MSDIYGLIPHQPGYHYIILSEDYVVMFQKAADLWYEQSEKTDEDKKKYLQRRNHAVAKAYISSVIEQLSDKQFKSGTAEGNIWVFLSFPQIESRVHGGCKQRILKDAMKEMIEDGYVSKLPNPDRHFRSLIYHMNLKKYRAELHALPKRDGENDSANLHDAIKESDDSANSPVDNADMHDDSANLHEHNADMHDEQCKFAPKNNSRLHTEGTQNNEEEDTLLPAPESASNDSSSANAPDAHTPSQFDTEVLERRIYEASTQDAATLPPVMQSSEDAYIATYQALVAQPPAERVTSATTALPTPQGEHTHDRADTIGRMRAAVQHLPGAQGDKPGAQRNTGPSEYSQPDNRAATDRFSENAPRHAHGVDRGDQPTQSATGRVGQVPASQADPSIPIATPSAAAPGHGDGYEKSEQQQHAAPGKPASARRSRQPKAPKVDPAEIERYLALFDELHKEVTGDPDDPGYLVSKVDREKLTALLEANIKKPRYVTPEKLRVVYLLLWNRPKDEHSGFHWQQHMKIKNVCEQYPQEAMTLSAQANAKKQATAHQDRTIAGIKRWVPPGGNTFVSASLPAGGH